MIVAIHQPQYLPWSGYMDKLDRVDAFVLLDTVQFTKSEWQNRNRFKTAEGWQWVSVPVLHEHGQAILEVKIDPNQSSWPRKHRNALETNYSATPHFGRVSEGLFRLWEQEWEALSPLNRATIELFAELIGIDTPVYLASEMRETPEDPDERLIALCRELGADGYLAGTAGPDYMDMKKWEAAGIEVLVQDFVHPEYDQPFGDFLPEMSAADLLCNCGPDALPLLRSANGRAPLSKENPS
jgi:hypothetical protein